MLHGCLLPSTNAVKELRATATLRVKKDGDIAIAKGE
jgi:hypothetical protein